MALRLLVIPLFFLVAYSLKPFTDWNITLAYGSVFIIPLLQVRGEYLKCGIACLGAYLVTLSVSLFDKNFIGHVPTLYAALGLYCYFKLQSWKAPTVLFSIAIVFYGFILLGIYGPVGKVNNLVQFGENVIFVLQVLTLGYGGRKEDEPKAPTIETYHELKRAA